MFGQKTPKSAMIRPRVLVALLETVTNKNTFFLNIYIKMQDFPEKFFRRFQVVTNGRQISQSPFVKKMNLLSDFISYKFHKKFS